MSQSITCRYDKNRFTGSDNIYKNNANIVVLDQPCGLNLVL